MAIKIEQKEAILDYLFKLAEENKTTPNLIGTKKNTIYELEQFKTKGGEYKDVMVTGLGVSELNPMRTLTTPNYNAFVDLDFPMLKLRSFSYTPTRPNDSNLFFAASLKDISYKEVVEVPRDKTSGLICIGEEGNRSLFYLLPADYQDDFEKTKNDFMKLYEDNVRVELYTKLLEMDDYPAGVDRESMFEFVFNEEGDELLGANVNGIIGRGFFPFLTDTRRALVGGRHIETIQLRPEDGVTPPTTPPEEEAGWN